jgi:hypothetical protein
VPDGNLIQLSARREQLVAIRSISVFGICFLVLFLRRPDFLLNAQFWAEDGAVWFSSAYQQGVLNVLLQPHTGYLQTTSRLVFGAAQFVPLEWAPTFANIIGLAIRCAPAAFLFSSRFSWADDRPKLAILVYYLLMPGLDEVHANVTNAHWYLGLYLLMVIIADPPQSRKQQVHDYAALALAGLSGPFILFLAPCFALRDWQERKLSVFTAVAASLALVQAILILQGLGTRPKMPLGATLPLFLQIISSRILTGFILPLDHTIGRFSPISASVVVLGFSALLALIMRKADWRIWCLAIFPTLLLGASMASPALSNIEDQWPVFLGGGDRYFVVPCLMLMCILVYGASKLKWKPIHLRALWVLPLPMLLYFPIEPLPDLHYRAQVEEFYELPVGERYVFEILPFWHMALVRR